MFSYSRLDELRDPSRYYRDSVPSSSHSAPRPTSNPATGAAGFSLYQFFAPGGLLSKTHPAYEFRRGQLQMAQAVEEALEENRHLIVEAGTGTGKTLAYLLPVIRSGKRVIISTGTKNLQEQLFFKDVPALEQALFPGENRKLSVCYMKGRNIISAPRNSTASTTSPGSVDWKRSNITAPSPPGRKQRKLATAPNSPNCPKPALSGTS